MEGAWIPELLLGEEHCNPLALGYNESRRNETSILLMPLRLGVVCCGNEC